MCPDQVQLLRATWAELAPCAEALAADFHDRLLALAPDAEPVFVGADAARRRAFVATLDTLVRVAADSGAVVTAAVPLGRRHAQLGATRAHYAAAGTALLQALETTLGERFTRDAHDAWSDFYALVAAVMCRAGRLEARPTMNPDVLPS